ncbi:lipid II flippase Amj family protein [Alteribacter aurantiacus]|uniref:lipid II flippase Amj family protein n=1 Tax=Alteribacter aurantiacus TaxID=254410 RepID=UPI0004190E8D|nr:lipid II flippase Amj family protein [Alteribacter aurantiacus]
MEFITEKVILISFFILVIHCIETLAYAVRISGARVKMIATALSLFNLMVIVSRTANMMQQPFTGSLIDTAPQDQPMQVVEAQFRFLIGASSIGTIVGILLLPTFIAIFSRAIIHLGEAKGSIPILLKKALTPSYIKRILTKIRIPKILYLKGLTFQDFPLKLFLLNMVITAIYTIGVLSALYAALIAPERASTAIMASGLINGIATVLLIIFVDPKISILADRVINQKGSYLSLKAMSILMVSSRLLGTILAQILFIPGAHYIAWLTTYIV